jgi:zinc D-Ala-D-Ala dipeptidase
MRRLLLAMTLSIFLQGSIIAHDLVDLKKTNPKICIDLRLASYNNSFGIPLYSSNQLYIERYVATRLGRVQRELAKDGIGLIVLEGFRPPSVQCYFDISDAERYCRGIGVDVMIYYLDGQPIKIPSFYQDATLRAYRDYPHLSACEYHNSYILEKHMTANGFVPQRERWWHFDLKGWESAPAIEVEYEELK